MVGTTPTRRFLVLFSNYSGVSVCDRCLPYVVRATDQTNASGFCRMLGPGADDTTPVFTLIDFNPDGESSALWSTRLQFTQTRRHCATDIYPLVFATISGYSFSNLFSKVSHMKNILDIRIFVTV